VGINKNHQFITKKCLAIVYYLEEKMRTYGRISICSDEKRSFDIDKLQRILYFSQIENMKRTGFPLFKDDFYAWPQGPVIPNLNIGIQFQEFRFGDKERYVTQEEIDVIDSVFEVTKDININMGEELFCQTETPWYKCYCNKGCFKLINKKELFEYYVDDSVLKQKTNILSK